MTPVTTPARADAASRDGIVTGTPGYMSPEQARGERVDARSDVWAFGCVVYEMLTAHPAFARVTPEETFEAIVARSPDWERLPPNVPVGIRRMLRRCLERDPRRRLHHVADARIEIEEAIDNPEGADSPQVASVSRRRERMLGVVTVTLALALIAALGAWFLRQPGVPEVRVVEITTPRTSDLWSFAISPDGRRLAFVADHDGRPTLWVRALDTATARALPGTEGARRPFWSPDSRSIGFFVNSELRRIDSRGGSPQTVAAALGGTTAAWGPGGTILFSSTAVPALLRVNDAGGNVEAATAPAADSTGHRHPQFLPGGRQFLFFVGGPDRVRGVYLGSLESSEVTRLVASDTQGSYVAPGWLLFIRQGTLWAQRFDVSQRRVSGEPIAVADSVAFEPIDGSGAFSTSDAGVLTYRVGQPSMTQLAWFDRSGGTIGAIGSPEQIGLTNLRLSPDGRLVAVERSLQNETDLWLLDATRQTRFTRSTGGSLTRLPVWSPDGTRIAFASVRSGSVALSTEALDRRWRRRRALRLAGEQDSLRLVTRRAISRVLRSRSEDGHRPLDPAGRHAGAVRLSENRRERAVGRSSHPTAVGWRTSPTRRADMRFTYGRFLREAARFRFPRPVASIRGGLVTARSCTSSPPTRS